MFDTAEQIEDQLLAWEDSLSEFKELRPTDGGVQAPNAESVAGVVAHFEIATTVAGDVLTFAGTDDRTLFLGVNDVGTPLGIAHDRPGTVERWLPNVATENCDPPIEPLQPRWAAQCRKPECRLFGDESRLALSAGAAKAQGAGRWRK